MEQFDLFKWLRENGNLPNEIQGEEQMLTFKTIFPEEANNVIQIFYGDDESGEKGSIAVPLKRPFKDYENGIADKEELLEAINLQGRTMFSFVEFED